MNSVDLMEVGRFGRAFGISGWIKVISLTTTKESILEFEPWFIKKNNVWEEFYFEDCKERANSIIVKLPNCSSPEQASQFTNIEIAIKREQLPELKDGEYYWDELIGLEVINKDNVVLGAVQSLMETGSNDVLVVVGEKRILVPYTSEVIVNVDPIKKIIRVDWEKDYL